MSETTAQKELKKVTEKIETTAKIEIDFQVHKGDVFLIDGNAREVTRVYRLDGVPHLDFRRLDSAFSPSRWTLKQLAGYGNRVVFVPPAPPEGVKVDSLWNRKDRREPWRIAKVEWRAERRRYSILMQHAYSATGYQERVTAKYLLANYEPLAWRDHDFSNPYCATKETRLCVGCGRYEREEEALKTPCMPRAWRDQFEVNVAEYSDRERSYGKFSIVQALDREKRPLPTKQRSLVQSHNLGAGMGVFTNAPDQMKVRELGKPYRPWELPE